MPKPWQLLVVPGSHFDLGWVGSIGETLQYCDDIIKRAVEDITGQQPDYRFTIEYALFAKHAVERYPELLEVIRGLVVEGRVEVCPSYTGMMDQVYDGETTLRNLVYGKRWCREVLGSDPRTAQQTDCPGHCRQLPQFLRICGIDNLVHSRFGPERVPYIWEAPDGSTVTTMNHMHGVYPGIYQPFAMGYGCALPLRGDYAAAVDGIKTQLGLIEDTCPSRWGLMGDESDCLFGDPVIVANIARWNDEHGDIARMRFGVISDYFAQMPSEVTEQLPTFTGEAPYEFYTLPAVVPMTYKAGRRAENLLAAAEKLSCVRQMLGLGRYAAHELEAAWERLFYSHDHNVGGRHGELNDMVRTRFAEYAEAVAQNELDEAMTALTTHIGYGREQTPVVVFNALSWRRSEPVESYLEFFGDYEGIRLVSGSGEEVPCQVTHVENSTDTQARIYFTFVPPCVPSIGYTTVYAEPMSDGEHGVPTICDDGEPSLSVGAGYLEMEGGWPVAWEYDGEMLLLPDNSDLGHICAERDIADTVREEFTGDRQEVEWSLGEMIADGPVFQAIQREGYLPQTTITQQLILYRDLSYMDLRTVIDWTQMRDVQIRMALPFDIPDGAITYESPYCAVRMPDDEMPGTYRGSGGRYLQKWVDLSNTDCGITVASNSAGYSLGEGAITPVLLRDGASCGARCYRTDLRGRHEFVHRLVPHRGSWSESLSHLAGWELNCPLSQCRMNIMRPIEPVVGEQFLPQERSFCFTDRREIAVTAMKQAYDGNGYILRIVDLVGKGGEVKVEFASDLISAHETDALEQGVQPLGLQHAKGFTLTTRPFGIHTVRVVLSESR